MQPRGRRIRMVHAHGGRIRLRVEGLHLEEAEATRLAEVLARTPGIRRAEVNRRTGSVLCEGDPGLTPERVIGPVRETLGLGEANGGPNDTEPPEGELFVTTSGVAREVARLFRDINRSVLRATDGQLDLGMLATVTFVSAGALEVALKKQIPAPPWFNLAWWGFRTFMTLEKAAIEESEPAPAGAVVGPAKTG